MTTTIGDQDLGFTAMADLRAGRTYRGKNFMAKMTTELKELILVLCEDPTELVLTCQSFHRLAALSVIRSRFVKRQFGPWCDIFALSCFSPFDAYVLDCFDPFSACGERRFRRLLRFVKSGEVLDQILNLGDKCANVAPIQLNLLDRENVSMAAGFAKPSKPFKRLLRFCAWAGHRETLAVILDFYFPFAWGAKELAAATSFAVVGKQTESLIQILPRGPQLERNHHQAFYQAIRSDQIHIADLLLQFYYRKQLLNKPEQAHAALNKGMQWVASPLTLHYLIKAGGNMMYFDWNYYAERKQFDQREFVFDDLMPVLSYHLSVGAIELEDFAEEAVLAAAAHGDVCFLESLVSLGGLDVSEGGGEALRAAASGGKYDVVEWLLAHMADPLFSESSALREACALGHTSIVALLASHGADVTACNHEALKAAAARGHSGCVQVCIRHGSDVHVENDCALRDACANGHSDTVKVLLEAGASASVALGVSSAVLEVIIRSSTLFGSVASPADCFGCGSTHVDELERVESFSLPLAEDHMGTCDHLEDAADGSRTQILLAVPGAIWELLGWTRSLWLGIADNGEEDLPWAVMRATAC